MPNVLHKFMVDEFWFAGIGRLRHGKISQANWIFWPARPRGRPLCPAIAFFRCCSTTGSWGTTAWHYRTTPKSLWKQGMMTAEVNIAIGAIDRIFKMTKDGKSNNRERQTPEWN
jgi:hypothetical protein